MQRMLMSAWAGTFLHLVFVFEMSHQSLMLPGLFPSYTELRSSSASI